MMNRKEKIMARMNEHYDRLIKDGYEVVGLFLQGSQNYGLDDEHSDIDTKAIVLPTLDDVVLGKPMVSKTLLMENDEHIDVKDIRAMFSTLKKQNINFVEILFTEFHIINAKYIPLLEEVFENRERIARMDNYAAINCMCGMAKEKFKALEHPYPATKEKIERFGYDPKQLHHILRMNEFMLRYINKTPYEECLKAATPEFLIKVKRGSFTLDMAREAAKIVVDNMGKMKGIYGTLNKRFVDKEMSDMLDRVAANAIKRHLVAELVKGE